ncbi:hypothetical protein BDL97_13G113700 [Sphagnum fallax]|nr:hypothetical protein BDL97_13G113700 [Sphagnum fallax]
MAATSCPSQDPSDSHAKPPRVTRVVRKHSQHNSQAGKRSSHGTKNPPPLGRSSSGTGASSSSSSSSSDSETCSKSESESSSTSGDHHRRGRRRSSKRRHREESSSSSDVDSSEHRSKKHRRSNSSKKVKEKNKEKNHRHKEKKHRRKERSSKESSGPVQLSKFLGRDKDDGVRRSAVSGKKCWGVADTNEGGQDKGRQISRNQPYGASEVLECKLRLMHCCTRHSVLHSCTMPSNRLVWDALSWDIAFWKDLLTSNWCFELCLLYCLPPANKRLSCTHMRYLEGVWLTP